MKTVTTEQELKKLKNLADTLSPQKLIFKMGEFYEGSDYDKYKYIGDSDKGLMICERVPKLNAVFPSDEGEMLYFTKEGVNEDRRIKLVSLWQDQKRMYAFMRFRLRDKKIIGRMEWTFDEEIANCFNRVDDADLDIDTDKIEIDTIKMFVKKKIDPTPTPSEGEPLQKNDNEVRLIKDDDDDEYGG